MVPPVLPTSHRICTNVWRGLSATAQFPVLCRRQRRRPQFPYRRDLETFVWRNTKRVRVLLTKLRYTNRDLLTNLLTSPSPRIQFSGDFSPHFWSEYKKYG